MGKDIGNRKNISFRIMGIPMSVLELLAFTWASCGPR